MDAASSPPQPALCHPKDPKRRPAALQKIRFASVAPFLVISSRAGEAKLLACPWTADYTNPNSLPLFNYPAQSVQVKTTEARDVGGPFLR